MQWMDVALLGLLALWLWAAVRSIRRQRRRDGCCCGSCDGCAHCGTCKDKPQP